MEDKKAFPKLAEYPRSIQLRIPDKLKPEFYQYVPRGLGGLRLAIVAMMLGFSQLTPQQRQTMMNLAEKRVQEME